MTKKHHNADECTTQVSFSSPCTPNDTHSRLTAPPNVRPHIIVDVEVDASTSASNARFPRCSNPFSQDAMLMDQDDVCE